MQHPNKPALHSLAATLGFPSPFFHLCPCAQLLGSLQNKVAKKKISPPRDLLL